MPIQRFRTNDRLKWLKHYRLPHPHRHIRLLVHRARQHRTISVILHSDHRQFTTVTTVLHQLIINTMIIVVHFRIAQIQQDSILQVHVGMDPLQVR